MEVGARVDVNTGDGKVYKGTYEGEEDSPVGLNPVIVLDNGNRVRGYECWWGPEGCMDDGPEGLFVGDENIPQGGIPVATIKMGEGETMEDVEKRLQAVLEEHWHE